MLINILLNLVSSLVMYIVVNTISSAESQKNQLYFRDILEKNDETNKQRTIQMQANLLNQLKDMKTDIMAEIKEATENIGKDE